MNFRRILINLTLAVFLILSVLFVSGVHVSDVADEVAPASNIVYNGRVIFNVTTLTRGLLENTTTVNITLINASGGGTFLNFRVGENNANASATTTGSNISSNTSRNQSFFQWNFTTNTSIIPDGVYNVTINVSTANSSINDATNITASLRNITIDNTPPQNITLFIHTMLANGSTITIPSGSTAVNNTKTNNTWVAFNLTVLDGAPFTTLPLALGGTGFDPDRQTGFSFRCNLTYENVTSINNSLASDINNLTNASTRFNSTFSTNSSVRNSTFFNETIDANLTQGKYNFYVDCFDRATSNSGVNVPNTNRSVPITLTIDSLPPNPANASVTQVGESASNMDSNETDVEYGSEVSIRCIGMDNVEATLAKTVYIRRPGNTGWSEVANATNETSKLTESDTQQLGNYLVACNVTDKVGNTRERRVQFDVVTASRQSKRGAPAAAIPGFKPPVAKTVVGSGITDDVGAIPPSGFARLLAEGGKVSFIVKGQKHSIMAKEIGTDSAILILESTPIEVSLTPSDIKDFDLDGDGTNDVSVTLNGIFKNKADISVTESSTPATPSPETAPGAPGAKGAAAIPTGTTGVVIAIIVIVIIVLIAFFALKRR